MRSLQEPQQTWGQSWGQTWGLQGQPDLLSMLHGSGVTAASPTSFKLVSLSLSLSLSLNLIRQNAENQTCMGHNSEVLAFLFFN